ncbi:aminoacyl-tRNA hydrolase [Candidatus Bipolaricaulota sp. J31]
MVGLGNPGPEYALTRHNLGFWVVDRIRAVGRWRRVLFSWGELYLDEDRALLKPLTYMNRSGEAVRGLLALRALTPRDLLLVHDDVDLPVGAVRLRERGGDGGHLGVRSVLAALGTEDVPRLKLGIGPKPEGVDLADYVLSVPPEEELERLRVAAAFAAEVAAAFLAGGYAAALKRYSRGAAAGKEV